MMLMSCRRFRGDAWCALALALASVALIGCDSGPSAQSAPQSTVTHSVPQEELSAAEFRAIVRDGGRERIVVAINRAKAMRYNHDLLLLAGEFWAEGAKGDSTNRWLGDPIVRTELADLLLQGMANEAIDNVGSRQMYDYVRQRVGDADIEVSAAAIRVLGVVKDPNDVPALVDLLKNGRDLEKRMACLMLTMFCTPAAEKAVAQLRADGLSRQTAECIAEQWQNNERIRDPQFCRSPALPLR